MTDEVRDIQVRSAAMAFVSAQRRVHGDTLPRQVLAGGFRFEGARVPLVGPQGIFKPAILDLPLTITTTFKGPYQDEVTSDGLFVYCYRGQDPSHPDNTGLVRAMGLRLPLIYFHGVEPGWYVPSYPAFILKADPHALRFTVAVEEALGVAMPYPPLSDSVERRAYQTALVRRRIHQQRFRMKVLRAYSGSCAICRLRHTVLLEAAHILPDTHPQGEPIVPNGLALCKLHHAAFDGQILGIRPDLHVEVRKEILEEEDGPMLVHGLKASNGVVLHVPGREHLRPRREFLEERYEMFRLSA